MNRFLLAKISRSLLLRKPSSVLFTNKMILKSRMEIKLMTNPTTQYFCSNMKNNNLEEAREILRELKSGSGKPIMENVV